jgi:ketosteroid isomerase-like protein
MVTSPEDLHPGLCAAFNMADLEALLSLYAPDAVYVIKPGHVSDGPDELRAIMQRLLSLGGTLSVTPASVTQSGAVALVLGSFTLSGQRRDGTPFERTSRFADVLRRLPSGDWVIAIDNPYGGE